MKSLLILALSLITIVFSAHAEDIENLDEMSLEDFMNMEVQSATKTKISLFESPQAVTVYHKERLRLIPAQNLAELVRTIVGVNPIELHTSQNMISTRGSNIWAPAKTLLLIDGQPVDPTIFSTTWWDLIPVAIEDIERLEFIRSPGTIYGENAQNGVINIITSSNETIKVDGHHGRAAVRWGEFAYTDYYAGYKYGDDKTRIRASVNASKHDPYVGGEDLEFLSGKVVSGEQRFSDDDPQFNLLNYSVGGYHKLGDDQKIKFAAAYKDLAPVRGRVPDRLCFVEIEGNTSYGAIGYDFGSGDFKHNIGIDTNQNEFVFKKNSDTSDLDDAGLKHTRLNFEYELKASLGEHTLLVGAKVGSETAEDVASTNLLTEKISGKTVFQVPIQNQWDITDKDRLFVGGLYSDHYISGGAFSPMLAYTRKLSDRFFLTAAVYASHRNPNIFEHSLNYDQSTGTSSKVTTIVANEDLKPEKTTSYELGVRGQFANKKLLANLNFYHQTVQDGIEWELVGTQTTPDRPIYQSQNTLDQTVQGIELDLEYSASHNLRLGGNLTLTSIENSSSSTVNGTGNGANDLGQGRYGEEYFPSLFYTLFAEYVSEKFRGRVSLNHVDGHNWQWPSWNSTSGLDGYGVKGVDAYDLVNASVTFDFGVADLTLEGINLFNRKHTEWRGDKSYVGRSFWAKLAADF